MLGVFRFDAFSWRPPARLMLVGFVLLVGSSGLAEGGVLDALRDDVRSEPDGNSDDESKKKRYHYDPEAFCQGYDETSAGTAGYFANNRQGNLFVWLSLRTLTSPIWIPRGLLDDDGSIDGYFPGFPYKHDGPGYMMIDDWHSRPCRWAVRLRSEYSEDFDDLSRIGGHLLLSTTSRWGIDTQMSRLAEQLPDGGRDHLWLGDCNLVFRFAQSPRSQWRTGIGLNWLDDPIDTDYGFNFTYGFDFYPVKPFVFSTELDWGTIGSAEAFHFRTTVGVLIHRFESYIGYEYRDIDRFHFNGLVAGVRIWF